MIEKLSASVKQSLLSLHQMMQNTSAEFYQKIEKIISHCLSKSFFLGYRILNTSTAAQRVTNLVEKHHAVALPCRNLLNESIDVLYIPSQAQNKTGNVIVFAETTSYQDRLEHGLPRKYKYFLDCGADIVLWNPTTLQGKQYTQDLLSVLQTLNQRNPQQKIVVKGYCATVEPCISSAADLVKKNSRVSISLILDRGSSSALTLARSFTILTQLPLIQRVLGRQFCCKGKDKLEDFPGKIIFIAPQDPKADQLMYWKGANFTYEMYASRQKKFFQDAFIKLGEDSDHWSPWNATEYHQIGSELHKMGIITNNYFISAPSFTRQVRSFFNKTCYPFLTKAWC